MGGLLAFLGLVAGIFAAVGAGGTPRRRPDARRAGITRRAVASRSATSNMQADGAEGGAEIPTGQRTAPSADDHTARPMASTVGSRTTSDGPTRGHGRWSRSITSSCSALAIAATAPSIPE